MNPLCLAAAVSLFIRLISCMDRAESEMIKQGLKTTRREFKAKCEAIYRMDHASLILADCQKCYPSIEWLECGGKVYEKHGSSYFIPFRGIRCYPVDGGMEIRDTKTIFLYSYYIGGSILFDGSESEDSIPEYNPSENPGIMISFSTESSDSENECQLRSSSSNQASDAESEEAFSEKHPAKIHFSSVIENNNVSDENDFPNTKLPVESLKICLNSFGHHISQFLISERIPFDPKIAHKCMEVDRHSAQNLLAKEIPGWDRQRGATLIKLAIYAGIIIDSLQFARDLAKYNKIGLLATFLEVSGLSREELASLVPFCIASDDKLEDRKKVLMLLTCLNASCSKLDLLMAPYFGLTSREDLPQLCPNIEGNFDLYKSGLHQIRKADLSSEAIAELLAACTNPEVLQDFAEMIFMNCPHHHQIIYSAGFKPTRELLNNAIGRASLPILYGLLPYRNMVATGERFYCEIQDWPRFSDELLYSIAKCLHEDFELPISHSDWDYLIKSRVFKYFTQTGVITFNPQNADHVYLLCVAAKQKMFDNANLLLATSEYELGPWFFGGFHSKWALTNKIITQWHIRYAAHRKVLNDIRDHKGYGLIHRSLMLEVDDLEKTKGLISLYFNLGGKSNLRDRKGRVPLDIAFRRSSDGEELMEFLLNHGDDPCLCNIIGARIKAFEILADWFVRIKFAISAAEVFAEPNLNEDVRFKILRSLFF